MITCSFIWALLFIFNIFVLVFFSFFSFYFFTFNFKLKCLKVSISDRQAPTAITREHGVAGVLGGGREKHDDGGFAGGSRSHRVAWWVMEPRRSRRSGVALGSRSHGVMESPCRRRCEVVGGSQNHGLNILGLCFYVSAGEIWMGLDRVTQMSEDGQI